jgi:hypothetical protein
MFEAIQGWAVCLVLAALAGTIVHMLSPSGNMEKILKTVVGVFFLAAVITPFANGEIDLSGFFNSESIAASGQEDVQAGLENALAQQTAEVLKRQIAAVLNGEDITKFEINVYISENAESGLVSGAAVTLLEQLTPEKVIALQRRLNAVVGGSVRVENGEG